MTTIAGSTDRTDVEALARKELRRSPSMWLFEVTRLSWYVLCRVVFVPWCLVWPAVTVWLIWWVEAVSVRTAIEIFAASPGRSYAWFYVLGATFHSLLIVGSDPYEWEIERRVRARVLTHATRTRWVRRADSAATPNAVTCEPPKGWERIEAGPVAS